MKKHQAHLDQGATNSMITQLSGGSYQTVDPHVRYQHGYIQPHLLDHQQPYSGQMSNMPMNGNLIYNNTNLPMTPNLRHSNSMYNGNMTNSMIGDPDSQLSVISQNSGSQNPNHYRRNKKQRANSYEDFRGGILDHDGDSAYEKDEDDDLDLDIMMDHHQPGQVPSGLIPPTNLQLG